MQQRMLGHKPRTCPGAGACGAAGSSAGRLHARHWASRHTLHVHQQRRQQQRTLLSCRASSSSTHSGTQAGVGAAAGAPPARPVWSSFVSRRINLELAVEEAVEKALASQPPGWQPELGVVFVSSAYASEYGALLRLLRARVPSLQRIIGSSGYGVIGSTEDGPEEIEHAPALSLALASLPGCSVSITHVTGPQLPDGDAPPDEWARLLGVPQLHSTHPTNFIVLAEPEFSQLQELTAGLDFAFPGANKIGGLVSAGKLSSVRAMFAWSADRQSGAPHHHHQQQQSEAAEQQQQDASSHQQQQQQQQQRVQQFPPLLRTGAVVLSLQGPVEMELLVAQGCRPLSSAIYTIDGVGDGGPVVTALRDERGLKLTPVEALQRELEEVASSRAELLALLRNMALGLMPEVLRVPGGAPPAAHEFLIRGCALSKAGFMVVGDSVRVGQRVRFMVRDREGAQQDLTSHCLAYKRRELAATLGASLGAAAAAADEPAEPAAAAAAATAATAAAAAPAAAAAEQPPPAPRGRQRAFGMLLFSCNGRGQDLYDQPSWDSRQLAAYIPVPCSGFLCNGEIGSLGGATHIHGFTVAAAILRAMEPAGAAPPAAPAAASAAEAAAGGAADAAADSGSSGAAGGQRPSRGPDAAAA